MSKLEEIKIELKGIGSIIKDRTSYVPRYQRAYAWKEDNIRELYQDIGNAIQSGSKEYFLGSLVMSEKEENRPEIVDGQQRLATISILLAEIRNYFEIKGDTERADWVFTEYLSKKDLASLELLPKLHLNDSDHEFYLNKIVNKPRSDDKAILPTKESHKRIENAAKIAEKHVAQIAGITSDPTTELIKWIQFVTDKAKVILVKVPDESNAFTIFETLNDRGLDLAVSDLIKNYLFNKSDDRITEVQQRWISMIARIESAENEQAVITFIRHLWLSKHGLVREKELFSKIKSSIKSKSDSIEFSHDLDVQSVKYAAIITCDNEYWEAFSDSSKKCVMLINQFNISQVRPLLLAILSLFDKNNVDKTLINILNWSVRFLIVGGLGSGPLETKFSECAMKVTRGDIRNNHSLMDFFLPIVPSDAEFKSSFSNTSVSKNYLARYYLQTIESVSKGCEAEYIPNPDKDVVTLEHILPENPSSNWGEIKPDDAKAYYKRIGNLTLLKKSINNSIGNNGFKAKQSFYSQSTFGITNNLSSYEKWGINEIEERQNILAELAVKAWPVRSA